MDSLFDVLAGKNFDEPAEIRAIKHYVCDTFQAEVGVEVRERDIVVSAKSAALAARLRFAMPQLQAAAQTTKRIVLRITG